MSDDRPDDRPDDALRRLLADARHTEPIPVDVAARLDDVLARLAEGDSPDGEVVDELAGRRRRRRAVRLLGAAAAVIVVGTAAAQFLDVRPSDDAASSSVSADAAGSAATAPDTGGDSGRASDAAGGQSELSTEALPQASAAAPDDRVLGDMVDTGGVVGGVPARFTRLDTEGFSAQVAALQNRLVQRRYALSAQRSDGVEAKQLDGCAPADWGAGTAVVVTYDGEPEIGRAHV